MDTLGNNALLEYYALKIDNFRTNPKHAEKFRGGFQAFSNHFNFVCFDEV